MQSQTLLKYGAAILKQAGAIVLQSGGEHPFMLLFYALLLIYQYIFRVITKS